MPSKCSFCEAEGHNIRTCNDPEIGREYRFLLGSWVYQRLWGDDFSFTERTRGVLMNFISRIPDPIIRAIGVQYGHERSNASTDRHIASIVAHIATIEIDLDQRNREQREVWCMNTFGMTIEQLEIYYDNLYTTSFSFSSHGHSPRETEDAKSAYEILFKPEESKPDMELECVICQTEKPADSFLKTKCDHSFCQGCICSYLESKRFRSVSCPLCRTEITALETTDQECYELLCIHFGEMGILMNESPVSGLE